MTRTLAQDNLEYAALKHIADRVKARMDEIKAEHLERLLDSAADTGAKAWQVTCDGENIASVTLSQRAPAARIVDESAVIDAVSEDHPDWLEHTVQLKDWARKQLLDSLADVTEDGGVTPDGEVVPGIAMSPAGEPYQSLRWAKAKGDQRGEELGRRILSEAIANGDLRELLAGTDLPLIGGGK